MSAQDNREKIKTLTELSDSLTKLKSQNKRIVHCHGVFDLLHIGHIRHLQEARGFGDVLVVTITPDRFVNKGPHRPAFTELLRAEALAALDCVDYVAINEWAEAVKTIELLKPDIYVKGVVKKEGKRDHTDAIEKEKAAVEAVGGELVLTDTEIHSASTLINRYLDVFSPEVKSYLGTFRESHDAGDIISFLRRLRDLKVLVIGETIVDEYQFCQTIGKANKDPVLVAKRLYAEKYAGGVLAVANHLAGFSDHVGLISMLGDRETQEDFVRKNVNHSVKTHFLRKKNAPTILKRRFLEHYKSVKLFEEYVMENERLTDEEDKRLCKKLEELLPQYEAVIVVDYGHGLLTEKAIEQVCNAPVFLAVNAQANSGNRGFNTISKYPRADYVAMAEHELRLETRDMTSDPRTLVKNIAEALSSRKMLLTRGESGCLVYSADGGFTETPAFATKTVDRIGAGDAVLSITAACVARGMPDEVLGFLANVVGAEACAIMGNKEPIQPVPLFRHIESLLK